MNRGWVLGALTYIEIINPSVNLQAHVIFRT